jgi:hypothetical protein
MVIEEFLNYIKKGKENIKADRIVREILHGKLTGRSACPRIIS